MKRLIAGEVVLVAIFAALALWVTSGRSEPFDVRLLDAAVRHRTPALTAVMVGFTWLGLPWMFAVAVVILSAVLFRRGRRAALILVALSISAGFANELLKGLFHRPRPTIHPGIPLPTTFSFPSGHAMGAMAIYGTAAFLLARAWPRWRRGLAVVAPILIALIGVSRVYLAVHWPTDVLAGFAAGGVLLLLAVSAVGKRGQATYSPEK